MMSEVITSRKNPLLQEIRRLNTSAAFRRERGLFVCEGPRLLEEALQWSWDIQAVIHTQRVSLPCEVACRRVAVPDDVFASLADTQSPQGVLFVCRLPEQTLPERLEQGRYLVLDGLQNPGNLGTAWRTADALGVSGLILVGACADPFGPKVVRGTMGACFRLPVWRGSPKDVRDLTAQSGIPLYVAALRGDARDVREVDLRAAAVAVGSEGQGVSEDMMQVADGVVTIPMEGKCESLNVAAAAAILLWEGWRHG